MGETKSFLLQDGLTLIYREMDGSGHQPGQKRSAEQSRKDVLEWKTGQKQSADQDWSAEQEQNAGQNQSVDWNQEGIEILKLVRQESFPGEILAIPEQIAGKPVLALAPYAFQNERWMRKVLLPHSLWRIGGHCFFDCRRLEQISLSDCVTELEDGALKNCEALCQVDLLVRMRKSTCLKSILSERNETLYVKVSYEDGTQAALVFPRYQLDFEANVEARIINQVTYGSGLEYRECFYYEDIDYKKYDDLFYHEQAVGEREITARLAAARLSFPYQLSEKKRQEYLSYLEKDSKNFGSAFSWYEKYPAEQPAFFKMISSHSRLLELGLNCARELGRADLIGCLMAETRGTAHQKKSYVL